MLAIGTPLALPGWQRSNARRFAIRNDAMPAPAANAKPGDRKAVFNEEVVAELAKAGFGPGAALGDTMHFDFIQGYRAAVPGGRSGKNMQKDRFSPEGPLPAPVVDPDKLPAKKP